MDRFEKIAVLENEAQAQLLDSVLTERAIPHGIISYHDSAYDGLFQRAFGWGPIDAATRYRKEILEILKDLSRPAADPGAGLLSGNDV